MHMQGNNGCKLCKLQSFPLNLQQAAKVSLVLRALYASFITFNAQMHANSSQFMSVCLLQEFQEQRWDAEML